MSDDDDIERTKDQETPEDRDETDAGESEARRQRLRRPRRRRQGHVMHTRISEDLDEALRRAAGDLRLPVSNVVRSILEDTFDVVETVTETVGSLVDDVVEEAQHLGQRFGDDWKRGARDSVREGRREVRDRVRKARVGLRDAKRALREAQRSSRDVLHQSRSVRRSEDSGPDRSVEVETEAKAAPSRDLPEFPDVLGWQPLVLNQPQECAGCGRAMRKGDRASLGLSSEGRPSAYLCELCVEAI